MTIDEKTRRRHELLAEMFPDFAGELLVMSAWSPLKYEFSASVDDFTFWYKNDEPRGHVFIMNNGLIQMASEQTGLKDVSKEEVERILKEDKLKHRLDVL